MPDPSTSDPPSAEILRRLEDCVRSVERLGDKDRVNDGPTGPVGLSAANFHGPNDSEPPLLRLTYAK